MMRPVGGRPHARTGWNAKRGRSAHRGPVSPFSLGKRGGEKETEHEEPKKPQDESGWVAAWRTRGWTAFTETVGEVDGDGDGRHHQPGRYVCPRFAGGGRSHEHGRDVGNGVTTLSITRPTSTTTVKGANWWEDTVFNNGGTTGAYGTGGTSVEFTLQPTAVDADVVPASYTVNLGTPTTVTGSATITAGFGSVASTGWDFNNDGTVDQSGNSYGATYEYLAGLGYVYNVPHLATYRGLTNDGVLDTDTTMITILPEPATMALLGVGGLAIVLRRRRTR